MKTFFYGLRQGLKNIAANKMFSLAAIGTIATCLFLMGIVYMLICNFQNMLHNAESTVGVTVFFEEGIGEEEINQIGDAIRAIDGVGRLEYVSPEEAWDKFQKEMYDDNGEVAETFGEDNPLADSASYEVYLKQISDQGKVSRQIGQITGVRKVVGSDTVAASLNSFNLLFAYISVSVIVLLFLVSLFLISSAVATGIRVRRAEISIIRLIGATNYFVRLPFLVEGVVIGMIGAAIPIFLLMILYDKVVKFVLGQFSILSDWLVFVDSSELFGALIPILLGLGIGIGFVGSALSVRRYLRD